LNVPRTPYSSIWERLIASTTEPENGQDCWRWRYRLDRWGYGLFTLYVPGLLGNATLKSHIALYCCMHADARTADDLFLAYQEQVKSGLQLDHLCSERWCCNPDHLDPVTPALNAQRRNQRATR
jgi:hypothetical protein